MTKILYIITGNYKGLFMDYSIGQFNFNNYSWMQNQMPEFNMNTGWNNFSSPVFDFSNQYWGSSSGASSSKKYETTEQKSARILKEKNQIKKIEEEKVEYQKGVNEIDTKLKEIEAGKQKDGSVTVSMSAKDYRKNVSWGKRLLRGLGNAATGAWKMVKSIAGFDNEGKWSPIKCIRNVALIAGAVAATIACPALGPVLLYAGLACGAVQVGKGVYNTCTAKTVEEIDNAWQDIGAGSATVLASRVGIKGMGKAANVDVSGLNFFKNAPALIKAQPKWIFADGFKGSGARFKANWQEMNPFKSRTRKELEKAEKEYIKAESGMSDSTLSEAERFEQLDKAIDLETKIAQLKKNRANEIVDSPLSWLRKKNRTFVQDEIGNSVGKEYWNKNTLGKGFGGKTWFVTKKTVKVAFDLMAPEFLLWNSVSNNSSIALARNVDWIAGTQYYDEGIVNGLIEPDAVVKLSQEDAEKTLVELSAQRKALDKEIKKLDEKSNKLLRA